MRYAIQVAFLFVAREQFSYPASESLFKKLEQLSQRSGVSRGAAFEDVLTAIVCALAAETKEEGYLAMVERHKAGNPGKRGVDLMGQMFGELVSAMEASDADILGDLFRGSITYGEAGQYFTPESVTKLLAQMAVDPEARPTDGASVLTNDPCCGTGRMLLEASNVNPHAELVGQDIDARCAKITAINLGLRGRYGWVLCGNSLSGDTQFAYRNGSFFNETPQGLRRGVIRDVPVEQTPVPVLAAQLRSKTEELFAEEPRQSPAESASSPTIIEVPQWLARLEPRLAAMHTETPSPIPSSATPSLPDTDDGPQTQRTLF